MESPSKELLAEKCPRLATHLDRLAVDLSLFTFNWFLCLFVDTIPPQVYLNIWDAFLYEGPKVREEDDDGLMMAIN